MFISLYDLFSQESKPKLIIGLSFFEPETVLIEAGAHDIALDICVQPNSVLRF